MYIVIGVGAGVSLLAFFSAIVLLACVCLVCKPDCVHNWNVNFCKCPKKDCRDCLKLDCGDCFKPDCGNCCKVDCKKANLCDVCLAILLVILGILASPIIAALSVVVGAVICVLGVFILIVLALLYACANCDCKCDDLCSCDSCDCNSCDCNSCDCSCDC